jgi:hypothetical protein
VYALQELGHWRQNAADPKSTSGPEAQSAGSETSAFPRFHLPSRISVKAASPRKERDEEKKRRRLSSSA